MVDKRSLRSSKKDGQDNPPGEEEKPKPTRTRSARSKKPSNKNQDTTAASSTEEESSSSAPAVPLTTQSEDVVMQTEGDAAPEKPNEDVEMKNADEEAKDDVPKEDPTASPLTGIV